jgi:serine/threonine protein kinase
MDPNDPNSPPDQASPKVIKLIDFDTSSRYDPTSPKSKSVVGTHGYIAPESYKGEYTPSSDLWSVGVIFYVLMTGDMPFENALFDKAEESDNTVGRGIEHMHEVLQDQKVDWDCPPWPDFPLARDLCQRLLVFDPEVRSPSAKDALSHAWLRE